MRMEIVMVDVCGQKIRLIPDDSMEFVDIWNETTGHRICIAIEDLKKGLRKLTTK